MIKTTVYFAVILLTWSNFNSASRVPRRKNGLAWFNSSKTRDTEHALRDGNEYIVKSDYCREHGCRCLVTGIYQLPCFQDHIWEAENPDDPELDDLCVNKCICSVACGYKHLPRMLTKDSNRLVEDSNRFTNQTKEINAVTPRVFIGPVGEGKDWRLIAQSGLPGQLCSRCRCSQFRPQHHIGKYFSCDQEFAYPAGPMFDEVTDDWPVVTFYCKENCICVQACTLAPNVMEARFPPTDAPEQRDL